MPLFLDDSPAQLKLFKSFYCTLPGRLHSPPSLVSPVSILDTYFKTAMTSALHRTMKGTSRLTIDKLPDDVLQEVFERYMEGQSNWRVPRQCWHTLVHVCRRWRSLVFASPRRLNLKIFCTVETPVEEMLNVWPDLPIIITIEEPSGVDNVIAILEHNDRVCEIDVELFDYESDKMKAFVGKLVSAMQKPFPVLTNLTLLLGEGMRQVFPVLFPGEFPRLRYLHTNGIPSPALRKLLLSGTDISRICLGEEAISCTCISPEEMVIYLSALARLEDLCFTFIDSPSEDSDSEDSGSFTSYPPLPSRIVLPALTSLRFETLNDSEYLEDLVARIDAPLLNLFKVVFTDDSAHKTPQLSQFIRRTPNFQRFHEARVLFHDKHDGVTVSLFSSDKIRLIISFKIPFEFSEPNLQTSTLAWLCNSPLLPLPAVEHLYISEHWSSKFREHNESSVWLESLHSFSAVKHLYLSKELVPRIMPVLQELVGERPTELLPTLQNISLEDLQLSSGSVQKAVQQLVAVRQLSGYPISVSSWKKELMWALGMER